MVYCDQNASERSSTKEDNMSGIIDVLETYVDLPYTQENISSFEDELFIDDQRIADINQLLRELTMTESVRIGRFYQRYLAHYMKNRLQSRHPETIARMIGYKPDPDMNFADPPSANHGYSGHDSELLTMLFELKFNQIRRVKTIGYNIPPGEQAILDAEVPYHAYLEMLNRKLSVMMRSEDIASLLPETLMILNNEIYENDRGVRLPVFYLTKTETTKQVNVNQIREITGEIARMVREGNVFERFMIVSLNRLASVAREFLNSIRYLSVASDTPDGPPIELRNVRFDIFVGSDLLIDLPSVMLVPEHRKLSDIEVENLFENTGWNRDKLQGMSIQDPVARYYGFDVDDVIEIKRVSATNSEIADHSYAYRVVRPLALFMSADETFMNKYLT